MHTQADIDNSSKRKGGFLTLLICCVLSGLLFLSLKPPFPPMEAEGMIIDFGFDETGFGLVEPKTSSQNAAPQISSSPKAETKVVTQTMEETVKVKEDKKVKTTPDNNTTKTTKTEEKKAEEKINENELYKSDKEFESESGSEGTSGGKGNEGDPSGDPDGGKGGLGNNPNDAGVGYDLKGRTIIKKQLSTNSLEPGKIVFKISVDKGGYIRSASYVRTGSTIVDQGVINNVKNQLINKQWFQAKNDAAETQDGFLTVNITMN